MQPTTGSRMLGADVTASTHQKFNPTPSHLTAIVARQTVFTAPGVTAPGQFEGY